MSEAAKRFHETWLGMVQPVEGLVVSIPALIEADCFERLASDDHKAFVALLERPATPEAQPPRAPTAEASSSSAPPRLRDPRELFDLLGYADHLDRDPPPELSLYIPEGPQELRPTAAFRRPAYESLDTPDDAEPAVKAGAGYRLLLWELPLHNGQCLDFDKPETVTGAWSYPPAKKLERLLRAARVPIGLLVSHERLRLVYAPHGEASGHIDFRVADMADVGGRPILDAMVMLLGEERLVSVAPDRQLGALLARSRTMQAEVTTALARQVFFALETLLKGFEAADQRAGGAWLRPVMEAEGERDVVYEALLSVLLRLVFLLYAEDNALLPVDHPLFAKHYSLYALFDRLEDERTRYPDAMDRRYAAWPGLLALFRAVYFGVSHGDLKVPPREGHLFNPHRFPFLEGFEQSVSAVPVRDPDARAAAGVPTIDDETVYQVLRSLIILRGERLSYRTLYVEQIGSVYEGLMGYRTLRIDSPSVRIKPSDSKTAPTWVSVEELLAIKPAQREKWLKDHAALKGKRATDLCKDLKRIGETPNPPPPKGGSPGEGKNLPPPSGGSAGEGGPQERIAGEVKNLPPPSGGRAGEGGNPAQAPLIQSATQRLHQESVKNTPVAHPGRIVIQPGEERKRTSSHYTPQSLSGPIVARALEPLLACFGDQPKSEQILSLKICDPAMGSGAFLVEACRYLGERLLEAWTREGKTESLFSAEDDLTTYARRQVAERCLYGVDKNPFAVELAKLSLWLITLQRDKPFTFLDHALRCGDSLVGVSIEQITAFHWSPPQKRKRKKGPVQLDLFDRELEISLHEALRAREQIAEMSRYDTPEANRDMRIAMDDADDALSRLRLIGDLLIGAFFAETKDKAREKERLRRLDLVQRWLMDANALGPPPELVDLAEATRRDLRPFHWPIEFPEVFWAGRLDPLTGETEEEPASLDSVVSNPPFMGQSKISGSYGTAYRDWLFSVHPGSKGKSDLVAHFFRRAATMIGRHGTAGLVATNSIAEGDTRRSGLQHLVQHGATIYQAEPSMPWPGDAAVTVATVHLVWGESTGRVGNVLLGGSSAPAINSRLLPIPERPDPTRLPDNAELSYIGTKASGQGFVLTPGERQDLTIASSANAVRIAPYIGGEEINTSPRQEFERYIINFGKLTLEEAEEWPDLLQRVRELVKPERDRATNSGMGKHGKKYWWQFGQRQDPLYRAIAALDRCLVNSQVSKHLVFAFQPTDRVFSHALNVFALDSSSAFAVLQSRIHDVWARLLASSMGTTLRYAATDCFETFPFPRRNPNASLASVDTVADQLYAERAAFMKATNQGLTKTYNALKDPSITAQSEHGPEIEHLRALHLALDRAVLEAYAQETSDPTWLAIEIPPYTTPETPAARTLHQTFEDHILDKLFALNALRA